MHALMRGTAQLAAVMAVFSCATPPPNASALARNEYTWVLHHGGCECGPVAYAPRSAAPSWLPRQTFATYIHQRTEGCTSRQFVITAFGDGGNGDVTADMNLARARAAAFVQHFTDVKYRRLDTLVFAGPHIAHPSTLTVVCPTDRLPEPNSF